MEEEINNEDNIYIFNENFKYEGNEEQILNLYDTNKKIENNDIIAKKIIKNIYNHPLLLNYNYCLFCLERRKTMFNNINLIDKHKKSNIKSIVNFLVKENIKLKYPANKNEKLAKRRFIHSCEHLKKEIINNNKNGESDTELYIDEKENIYFLKKGSKISDFKKKASKDSNNNLALNSSFNSDTNNYKYSRFNSNRNKFRAIMQTKSTQNKTLLLKKNSSNNHQTFNDKENIIFQRKIRNVKTKKVTKPLSLFGFTINPFNDNKKNESTDFFIEPTEEGQLNNLQYFEKNEKCGICLGEIKDKFTLFCGDFFCRECIINLLKESINNISDFNKLICPTCKEPINESTITFLLKGKSLKKKKKKKMRIDGLKNPNNIPCPFPDCEGFAFKDKEINGTYKCQNEHIFCKKCLEIIDNQYRNEPKYKHECEEDKFLETTKYLETDKNIRKCPRCNCWVERDPGGCNYFRCGNIWCKYEFCWICGNKYEPSHYKNPLSTCFRLQESDYQGELIKSNRIRRVRCILIILLLILILFPIVCIFFSFFAIFSFVMYFHFDGKELKNARLKSKISHKIFYIFYFSYIFLSSLSLLPFGYMLLVLLIITIPIIIIIKKIRKQKNDF